MKKVLTLLLGAAACYGQATLTPAAPAALIGTSVGITASQSVTWSLTGPGSLSGATATTVTYNAPSSYVPQNNELGCQVWPNDSIFVQDLSAAPVNSSGAEWFNTLQFGHSGNLLGNLQFQGAWGVSPATATTPTKNWNFFYRMTGLLAQPWPFPGIVSKTTDGLLRREGGNMVGTRGYLLNTPTNVADHHSVIIKISDCSQYETYNDLLNGALITCTDSSPNCNATSGFAFLPTNYLLPTTGTTDAGGLPISTAMSLYDIKHGINHLVRWTQSVGGFEFSAINWPATATAGGCAFPACQFEPPPNDTRSCNLDHPPCGHLPPMGAISRVKSSISDASICNSGVSNIDAYCTNIMEGLKHHGFIMADTGSGNAPSLTDDAKRDPEVQAAVLLVTTNLQYSPTNFEFVDVSTLQFSATSSAVCPNGTSCLTGTNTTVTPLNQAILTATTTVGSLVTKVPIGIQGVGIGTLDPQLFVMAGTYSYQIPSWVTPSSVSQTVTWTKTSGVGSITSGGVYTPPATTGGGTAAILHGVAAADTNVSRDVYVTIFPAGTNPTNGIRIDIGSLVNNTDDAGNVWLADKIGAEIAWDTYNQDNPNWFGQFPVTPNASQSPEWFIYQSRGYGAHDLQYSMVIPNGNYKVRLGAAEPYNGCGNNEGSGVFPCGTFRQLTGMSHSPVEIDIDGKYCVHQHFIENAEKFLVLNPDDIFCPAAINGSAGGDVLRIYDRPIANDLAPFYTGNPATHPAGYGNKISSLNLMQVIPDTTAAHWEIDTEQQTTISPGATNGPMFVIDWYTGDPDATSPVWSIVNGPPSASINSATGAITLASSPVPLANQPITVKAAGASHSATTTIFTTGARYAINPIPLVNHFNFKRSFVIDHTKVPNTDQANFPVLVSVTDPTLATAAHGGNVLQPQGFDLVITSDSACATIVPFEVERYNVTTGEWVAWFKATTLSHTTNTTYFVCYNNNAIATDQSNAVGVWDSNFTGVYHLNALGTTPATTPDSTVNARVGTVVPSTFVTGILSGQIAGAANMGSNVAEIRVSNAVFANTSGTIENWVFSTVAQSATWNTGGEADGTNNFTYMLSYNPGPTLVFNGWQAGGVDNRVTEPFSTFTISTGTWHHLAYTWTTTGPAQKFFLDGAQVSSTFASTFTTFSPANPFSIGAVGGGSNGLLGKFDEWEFSNVARSNDWIATTFNSQSSPSTFATLGAQTPN